LVAELTSGEVPELLIEKAGADRSPPTVAPDSNGSEPATARIPSSIRPPWRAS